VLVLDHVIFAVGDLDVAAQRLLEEHGLDTASGGRHEGLGTANRIVPLGDTYLELIGVDDPAVAAGNPFGHAVQRFAADGDGVFAWALATDDIVRWAESIGATVAAGRRVLPDGSELRWRMAGIEAALADRSLPFFLRWDGPPEHHPGRTPVHHRVDVKGIAELEVAGDRDRIGRRLGGEDLPVRIVPGARPGPVSVTVATGGGEVVLR
jgi:hypothetical protein